MLLQGRNAIKIDSTKTPSDVALLGRTSSEVFVMLVVVVVPFLFFVLLLLFILLSFLFLIHCFSSSALTHSWTIARFLRPFYTFSPAYCRLNRDTFILTFPRSSFQFYRKIHFTSATILSGDLFLPTSVFYLTLLLHRNFTCFYQGLPESRQLFLKFAGLHTD